MSEPKPPAPDHLPDHVLPDHVLPDHVLPDHVLEELLDAFSEESAPQYNFDDPSIDRLLGITDEHASGDDGAEREADHDDEPDDDDVAVDLDDEPDDEPDDDNDDDDGDDDGDGDDEPTAGDAAGADQVVLPLVPVAPVDSAAPRRTIVIAEDDRPDSVYLDEDKEKAFHQRRAALDESGERSTIVIADLDEAGPTEPAPAGSRGGLDPRIRARRISVRRAEGRRRLVWAGIGIGVVLLAIGAVAVFASSIFDVREVTVQGAVYTDADVLEGVIADLRGEPVLLVDTDAAEQRLEAVPWVERAHVATDFPHRVVIDIRERRPIAAFQGGDQQFRIIDVQGRVLDVIAGQPTDYLLITGSHPDTARGQFAGAPYADVAELVLSLPVEVRSITRTVGVDASTGTLTLVLENGEPDGVLVRVGDSKNIDEKLARLLNRVRKGLTDVCQLDVSTADAGAVPC